MKNHMVRIGAGCSVDITLALPQMVRQGNLDYLVIDFLTEVAISKLAAEKAADPKAGYATGFAGAELATEPGPRFDIMGKGLGQQLLDFPVPVPADLARRVGAPARTA